jgi:hypothetical protein
MSRSCAQWRGEIGACIVGALDSTARGWLSRHLADCPGCRADYEELAPLRDWLSQLTAADVLADTGQPDRRQVQLPPSPPAVQPGTTPRPHHSRDAGTRLRTVLRRDARPGLAAQFSWKPRVIPARARRWLLASAGLAAGAAVAGILLSSGPAGRTYQAASTSSGVSGQVELHSTPVGTQIDLTASGLHPGERCILVALARGSAEIAGTWDATYKGSARIVGTSAFPASQLTALRIESPSGLLLLSIRV